MSKYKFSVKGIPGWAIVLAIFGVLYATGLHTETIGQVQRLLLATGIKNAPVPDVSESKEVTAALSESTLITDSDFRMTDLNGNAVNLSSLKGKVIFLNIWATWCPPCVAEMPAIQSLYEKVSTDKIAFVMLSVDEGGIEKVKKYINNKEYTFPVYLPLNQLPQELHTSSIPTTFVISPEGKVVAKQEGIAKYDTNEFREFLLSMAN